MAAMIIKRVVASTKLCSLGNFSIGPTSVPQQAFGFVRSDKVSDCFHQLVEVDRLRQDTLHTVEIDGWYR
jgi:hypothetical protein